MENVEEFLHSCQEGNLKEVEHFLEEGLNPNVKNTEGDTALQISAANGYLDIVAVLLKKGAYVNFTNNYGWTPLMHAVRHGHFEVANHLIRNKAKINLNNKLGVRAIDLAVWHGNLSCIKLIIDSGTVIDRIALFDNDYWDISPLMIACLEGHIAAVEKLIEEGSEVNYASPITGLTPLMLAACNNYLTIVEILIGHECDANATDICERTALDFATLCHNEEVAMFLKRSTVETMKKADFRHPDNIIRLVRAGNITKLRSMLEKNECFANYFELDDDVTPLMTASMLGFFDIADLLITYGADLNAQDKINGWTPLMYAVFHRQPEIVHLLLEKGADIDVTTSNGYNAMDLAIHTDNFETDILDTLLAYSDTEEVFNMDEYLETLSCSPIEQSHLDVEIEMTSSRSDSPEKFKDLLGDFSGLLPQLSGSSSFLSPAVDLEDSDESLNDVFSDDDEEDDDDDEMSSTQKKISLCVQVLSTK